jgi:biopolymer transport protein ExbD
MKFPRNVRIVRSQIDAAPYASVFFLLVVFVLLGSFLYTPGVHLQLPEAGDLPGTDRPTIAVAVDKWGRYYFQNQLVPENELANRLSAAVAQVAQPLTLVVQADKDVTDEHLIRLTMLARQAGIHDLLLATLPRVFNPSSALPSVAP